MSPSKSSKLFPGTDELLLHPSPKEVIALPAESVTPFMLAQLDQQAGLPYADFETTLGLGQLARLLKLEGMQPQLEAWLQRRNDPQGHDTAALFLAGFWQDNPEPSPVLVERLLAFLAQNAGSLQVIETLLLALSAALATRDEALREAIRGGLRPLLPLYPLLQTTSQTLLHYGLPIPDEELPKARPDCTDFRAFFCNEGENAYISIEHAISQCETVRVLTIVPVERTLQINYKILAITCTDKFAQQLIARTVLLDLCEDRYRAEIDAIDYRNPARKKSTTVPYAGVDHVWS